jgi:hypothetical protein
MLSIPSMDRQKRNKEGVRLLPAINKTSIKQGT